MLFAVFPFGPPTAVDVVRLSCLFLASNTPFALIVWHDARRGDVPRRAGRLFTVITLFTNVLGLIAYISYQMVRRSRMPAGAARPPLRPRTAILLVEIGLAAIVIALYYLIVRRVISLSEF
jgi:hypothetical protein